MNHLARRSFFQGALSAAAALRVLGANNAMRVGIVGLGGRGSAQLEVWGRHKEVRVTGLCDVNQAARERAQSSLRKADPASDPKLFSDMRALFESSQTDAVAIVTPNHWHALATIWACQAGKDVYVEKPASHNVYEGWKMVETARQLNRMVQIGSQSRSIPHKIRALQLVKEGAIGDVYLARGLCFKRRKSIGVTPAEPVPPGIDWDLFLGPAPMRPFTMNRFRYNWHWFWDTGNGDLGNQGVHQMDICRWAIGEPPMPDWVFSSGGKFVYTDDQETPNTQQASFGCGSKRIDFEVRGLRSGPEAGLPARTGNTVGNLFLGSEGWMWLDADGYQVYKGESNEKSVSESGFKEVDGLSHHVDNFLQACRARDHKILNADVEIGTLSAAFCHLANVSYRLGRKMSWRAGEKSFDGDREGDVLLSRNYRKPYIV
jgi:hypothetical protein